MNTAAYPRTLSKFLSAAALSAIAVLAGCSGGGSAPAPLASPAAPSGPQTAGSVVFTIGTSAPIASSTRRTQFVSPSSASVAVTAGGATVYSDVSATSPLCTTAGTTRTCTVPVSAPAGADTITIALYSGATGTGNLLGQGSGSATVVMGQPFNVTITVSPVVGSLTNAVITYASGSSFASGTAGTATVAFTAVDPAGNAIPGGTASFATPIALMSSDTHVSVTPASWTGPSQAITLTYDGSPAVANSVTVTATSGTNRLLQESLSFGGANLYVAELGNNSLTVTPAGASGNTAPTRTISGANTQISNNYGLAIDSSGATYLSGLRNATITVYASGANGNIAPIRTISGAATGLSDPLGLAVDANGNLIVANFSADTVTVYAPGASGNAVPIRTISGTNTALAEPYGIALDASGNLYVVDNVSQFGGVDEVTVYAAGASGNVAPTRTITGAATGMSGAVYDAVDGAGNIYVTNATANSVTVYGAGANGNAAPVATISGAATGLSTPYGIILDGAGNIYVGNGGTQTITVFAAGANGNVAPIRTISGAATGISAPVQMLLGP